MVADLLPAAAAIAAGLREENANCDAVTEALTNLRIPAISVALVRGGEVVGARAWGTRDLAGQEPASPATRFMAGSVSKPVTATGALRLVADGVLELDADIDDYLQRWHVPPIGDWQPTLTLRHLLSHTAGTTVHGFPGYRQHGPIPDAPAVLRGEGNTPAVVVNALPGLRARYSGGGTTVVQVLLEDVTGEAFPDLMGHLVLAPTGMTTAGFAQPPPSQLHPLLAEGTTADGEPVPGGWHVYPEMAAAGLWCTPTDLARWVIAVQRSIAGDGWLPQELAAEMVREQAPGWGLGPRVTAAGRHPRFEHAGHDEGFLTQLTAGQYDGTGVVVMASSNAAGPLMRAVIDAVVAAEGWPDFPTAAASDLEVLAAGYVGEWVTADGSVLRVEAAADGLVLTLPGQRPLPLTPQSLSLWSTPVGAEVEFAPAGVTETPTTLTIRPASAFIARRERAPESD